MTLDPENTSKYANNLGDDLRNKTKSSLDMNKTKRSTLANIFKPSLKKIIQNKQMGLSKYSNINPSQVSQDTQDQMNRLQTPIGITQSRVEQLANLNQDAKNKALEENKLVEKYLKGLSPGNGSIDMDAESDGAIDQRKIKSRIKTKAGLKIIKDLDIIPDDSVSVADRAQVQPFNIQNPQYDENSAISMDSSVVGKVNPIMGTFYQERDRIRRRQEERLRQLK